MQQCKSKHWLLAYDQQQQQQQAPASDCDCVYTIVKESREESLDDKIFVILNVCQKLLRYV